MASRSSDRDNKDLLDEISYLSRLIRNHQRNLRPRGGAQTRVSNRYTKVNSHGAQAHSTASSQSNPPYASVCGGGASSAPQCWRLRQSGRIVKKYKVNNVNRPRTSLQRPLRPQYGNGVAASKRKQSWPPSYSTTHYFHGQKRKSSGKPASSAGSSQAHYIKIGNITYKSSRNKLSRTFKKSLSCSPASCKASPRHERVLVVRGSVYTMDAAGKVLRRISQPLCSSEQTNGQTRIDVGGKTYIERKPGVLSQTPSAETRTYLSRTVNRSIHRVRNVGNSQKLKQKSYCMFFNRFGRCNKGDKCAYVHDPEKVAVCTRFLRGTCKTSDCPFSHKIAPEKMPVCSYFLKGRCTNDPCPYRHVKVSSKAAVCKDFAVRGYCADGIKCKKQHILICPEHAANKQCPRGNKCYLSHRIQGTKRKCEENAPEGATEDSSMPAVPLKASKESMNCAGPSRTTEDEQENQEDVQSASLHTTRL
ncbi:hypothetical protein MRX96_028368 [Rhipicephalus microplus]